MRATSVRLAAVALLALALGACGGADSGGAIDEPSATQSASNAVRVVDIGFDPKTVTVAAGTTVTWTNVGDLPHSVTSSDDGKTFDSNPKCPSSDCMKKGDTFRHTFDEPGTYSYICKVHGSTQTGTVTVTA